LKKHDGWTLIAAHFEKQVAAKPTAEGHEEIAQALRRSGRTADADALTEKTIGPYPKHPRRAGWRVANVMRGLGTPSKTEAKSRYASTIDALKALEETAKKEADTSTALAACAKRASLLVQSHRLLSRRDESKPLYEHVISTGGKSPHVATTLMGLANLHYAKREFEAALPLLERIVYEFPSSPEARRAPVGIKRLKGLLDK
jgi:hypothetical protein